MPEGRRDAVMRLNALALEHAFGILSHGESPVQALEAFFRLTTLAVENNMRYGASPDDLREAWSAAEMLPDFARALALWSSAGSSSPNIKHWRPISSAAWEPCHCLKEGKISICCKCSTSSTRLFHPALLRIEPILPPMSFRYGGPRIRNWHAINDKWAESATTLANAIAADGPERARTHRRTRRLRNPIALN